MLHWIESILSTLSYPGIALLMFLECVFPPIPSELIMPLSGFTARQGGMQLWGVVVAGTIGSMAGALFYYYLGKFLGTERLTKFADKNAYWLTVSGRDISRADKWFDRYGNFVVLFCRLIPGIRSLISLPAGVAEMRLSTFLIYSTVGTLVWNIVLSYAGYALGENYQQVEQFMDGWGTYILLTVIAISVIWYFVRLVQQLRARNRAIEHLEQARIETEMQENASNIPQQPVHQQSAIHTSNQQQPYSSSVPSSTSQSFNKPQR